MAGLFFSFLLLASASSALASEKQPALVKRGGICITQWVGLKGITLEPLGVTP